MISRFEELRNKLGLSRREIHERTYNINPAWLAGWSDDDQQPQAIEKVVEKIVYVEKDIGRIPPYWNNDNTGKLIKWKERRRAV